MWIRNKRTKTGFKRLFERFLVNKKNLSQKYIFRDKIRHFNSIIDPNEPYKKGSPLFFLTHLLFIIWTFKSDVTFGNFNVDYHKIVNKVYWPSPVISIRLKWKLCHLAAIYVAIHRFLIKFRHYGIDQLYLRKVP